MTRRWTLANALGWGCAMAVMSLWGAGIPGALAMGLIVGAAQALALRRRIKRSAFWWLGAAVAWFAGIRVGGVPPSPLPDPYWTGAVGGGLAGLLHWLVLVRQVKRSYLWPLVSVAAGVAGWLAGSVAGWWFYDLVLANTAAAYLAGGILGGITMGLASAPVLNWLLQNRREQWRPAVRR